MSDYIYGIWQELQFNTLGTDLTHTWDFGDGTPISSDPAPIHIYALPGTYTIVHGARDFCGACLSVSHTVDIVQSSITVRSILLSKYTAKVGDIITVTVIAQNLSSIFGTGTIVVKFNDDVVGTFNATLDPNQEVSFDVFRQVTTAGTINVCADNICTVLFVESRVNVQSITLDTNISTGNPIIATIGVQNTGTFTEDKTIQTTLTNAATLVIDERTVTVPPGTMTYDVPITITGLSNGIYTVCAETICKALSVAIPTETTGKLSIASTPTGAEICIDGVRQLDTNSQPLITPATITDLSPTNYNITLKLSDYVDYATTINIIAGQTTYLNVSLMQAPILTGNVNFTTTPDGASIFIDNQEQIGKFTPTTITDIPIGSHTFTLRYPGRNNATGTINVIGGVTSYVYVDMSIVSPTEGSIGISSIPQDADIYIDNTLYSIKTPTTIDNLEPNVYTIVLKKTGYNDYTTMINAIAGQTISINITLIPKVIMVGLEFPWWLVLGIGIGMFHAGKYKELKEIKEIVSSSKGRIVTLTKKDYTVK